jgi:hypothetical protein
MARGERRQPDEETITHVLTEIAAGRAIRNILAKDTDQTQNLNVREWYEWLKADESLVKRYARACEDRAHSRNDEISEIIEKMMSKQIDPNTARVAIDAIKWQMSKENAKFADRVEVSGSGVGGLTINVIQRFGDKPIEIEDAQVIVPELPGSCHPESGKPVDNSKSGQKR